jgi:zinc/manganese transport system permease protein
MLAHEFMRNALLAGSGVALACGVVGYLVVLRSQVFAGDALGHVAFTGALAAVAVGVDVRVGLFVGCVAVALAMAALGERARADDVVIGSVFAWILGLGTLFLALFAAGSSGTDGVAGARVLFGSILGLSTREARLGALLCLAVVVLVVLLARPLVFSSVDPLVAAAQGLPVALLGTVFLALVGVTSAEATQAVGALLLLGLLAAPGGAALLLVRGPYAGMAVSAGIALAAVWLGLWLSYTVDGLPPSTAVVGVAVAAYAAAGLGAWLRRRRALA